MVTAGALGIASAQAPSITSVLALGTSLSVLYTHLIDVTVIICFADKLLHTDAVEAVLEVRTARVAAARRLAHSLDTQLVTEAVPVVCAHGAAHSIVAHGSTGALLVSTTVLHWHTSQQRISSGTSTARAHGLMVVVYALSILSTHIGQSTRINADRVQTSLGHGAIVIIGTLNASALHMGIATSVAGTSACRRMISCDTFRIPSTGILDIARVLALGIDTGG